ncbi:MAG: hypothetical protein CMJ48_05740 [Planctomycetaceae bacterium]|nr:hypothetical protein [Planctomycetaceae bacterium]
MTYRFAHMLLLGSTLLLAGCGDAPDDTSEPADDVGGGGLKVRNAKEDRATAPAAAPTETIDQRRRRLTKKKTDAAQEKVDTLIAEADPEDVFVLGADARVFVLGDPEPTPPFDSNDEFGVLAPAEGESSSTFSLPPAVRETASLHPENRVGVATPGKTPDEGENRLSTENSELPEGFSVAPGSGVSASGLPNRIVCDLDGAEMVLIEAGVFPQGRNLATSDSNAVDVISERSVFLDTYYVDVYEVTVGRYLEFVAARKLEKERAPNEPLNRDAGENYPAAGVSWSDAKAYAGWSGRNLPSEAQWEKAARSAEGFLHPWGNGRAIWPTARKLGQIDPIGTFPGDQSVYGVFDLAGNVREWCADWHGQPAGAKSESDVVRNPTGPRTASKRFHRIVKGNGPGWGVWNRGSEMMRTQAPGIGFRTVLAIASTPEDDDGKKPTGSTRAVIR